MAAKTFITAENIIEKYSYVINKRILYKKKDTFLTKKCGNIAIYRAEGDYMNCLSINCFCIK